MQATNHLTSSTEACDLPLMLQDRVEPACHGVHRDAWCIEYVAHHGDSPALLYQRAASRRDVESRGRPAARRLRLRVLRCSRPVNATGVESWSSRTSRSTISSPSTVAARIRGAIPSVPASCNQRKANRLPHEGEHEAALGSRAPTCSLCGRVGQDPAVWKAYLEI